MTRDKAHKRAIRARMSKTGERYAAARRNVDRPTVGDPVASEAAVREATGKSWRHWFRVLDAWGADRRTHRDIARHLQGEQGLPGWWAQAVTVSYERARGMRAKYQKDDGFEVNVSKTLPVALASVWRAVTDARSRTRWLEAGTLRTRATTEGKTARFDGPSGTRVLVAFEAKGPGKSTVYVAHSKLPSGEAVEEQRAFWRERLARLAEVLAG